MSYSEPLLWQLYNFLFFIGFGFLSGFLFRFIEFVRELFSSRKAAVIVQDIVFSVLATILMFVFLLTYADGKIRLNLILAAALGAAVFFLTVGKAVKKAFGFFAAVLRKTLSVLVKPLVVPIRLAEKAFAFLKIAAGRGFTGLKTRIKARKEPAPKQEKKGSSPAQTKPKKKTEKRAKKPREKRKKHLKNPKK